MAFCKTSSSVRLCWSLQNPKDLKKASSSCVARGVDFCTRSWTKGREGVCLRETVGGWFVHCERCPSSSPRGDNVSWTAFMPSRKRAHIDAAGGGLRLRRRTTSPQSQDPRRTSEGRQCICPGAPQLSIVRILVILPWRAVLVMMKVSIMSSTRPVSP